MRRRTTVLAVLAATAFVVLCTCAALVAAAPALAEDIAPPVVTTFSIMPSHFDTSSAAQTLTVELTVQDAQSGVASVEVQLQSSLTPQWVRADAVRVSGTAADGVYTADLVVPRGSMSGTWHSCVWAFDGVGNYAALQWMQLGELFGAGTGDVVNDAAVCDSAPPQVTAVSVTPAHVDTSADGQKVTVSVTLADDMSGVDGAVGYLRSARSDQAQWVPLARTSGDAEHGVYTGVTTLPRYSASGRWEIHMGAQDAVGNAFSGNLAETLGDAATTMNDAAVDDIAPPQLTALSVTPVEFNTESGEQKLTVTTRVTDDLAGVSSLFVYVRPLLSDQWQHVELKPATVGGLDCLLTGTITLPQGAEVGTWSTDVEAYDLLGNKVKYLPDQLAAALPDAVGITLVNTAEAQQVTIRKEWVLTGEQSSVTFPAGTVVTRREGGSFAFYKMVAQPFGFSADVPTEDLQGQPVATLRFGIPGLNLSFSQPVTVRMRVGDGYDGYLVRIQSLTEGGQAWANETQAAVVDGWAQFTVGHATRFVAVPARARVNKVSPRACRRRARVTITGLGFGEARGRSVVLLGGRACRTYTRWAPRSLTFVVPRNATLGRQRLSVRVLGATTPAGRLTVRR